VKLEELALKAVMVIGFLLGVYVFDRVLDFFWPSNIPDWVLWGGCNRILSFCNLGEREN